MAFYRQNVRNIPPRNGTAPCKDAYPRGVPVYDAAGLPQSMTNAGSTQPSGGFRAQPAFAGAAPVFGTHDGLRGQLMRVAQADTYDGSRNPWPANGVWDQPGAPHAASELVRLAPSTSAHPGLVLATGAGPTMLFVTPPVFTVQTRPIYATGL